MVDDHWYPLSARRGDSPSSAQTTFRVLICLAVIRQELTLAKDLDAATEKALDEVQLGGLAWITAGYGPRSLRTPGHAWDPARDYGASFGPVLSLYGIEKIGNQDPYLERTILLLRRQSPDGSWKRHRYSEPDFEATAYSVLALCRFATRGW